MKGKSRYLDAVAATQAHIFSLYVVIVFLMLVCIGLWTGWREAPRHLRITIPPDLRTGAIVRPGEFQAAQVFAFAQMYLLALNRWEENGQEDYPNRIEELQAYFTPNYRDELIASMNRKMNRGELEKRRRYALVLEDYKEYRVDHVTSLGDGSWRVEMALEIVEKVSTLEAKRVKIFYPLHVVRINIDPAKNIWGLALDGMVPGETDYKIKS